MLDQVGLKQSDNLNCFKMKTIYKILICVLILAVPDLMLFENNALGFEPFTQVGFTCLRGMSLLGCLIVLNVNEN